MDSLQIAKLTIAGLVILLLISILALYKCQAKLKEEEIVTDQLGNLVDMQQSSMKNASESMINISAFFYQLKHTSYWKALKIDDSPLDLLLASQRFVDMTQNYPYLIIRKVSDYEDFDRLGRYGSTVVNGVYNSGCYLSIVTSTSGWHVEYGVGSIDEIQKVANEASEAGRPYLLLCDSPTLSSSGCGDVRDAERVFKLASKTGVQPTFEPFQKLQDKLHKRLEAGIDAR